MITASLSRNSRNDFSGIPPKISSEIPQEIRFMKAFQRIFCQRFRNIFVNSSRNTSNDYCRIFLFEISMGIPSEMLLRISSSSSENSPKNHMQDTFWKCLSKILQRSYYNCSTQPNRLEISLQNTLNVFSEICSKNCPNILPQIPPKMFSKFHFKIPSSGLLLKTSS